MRIIKKPLDPIATRISCGGIAGQNYIVYRGDLEDVKDILVQTLKELSQLKQEPEIDYSELEQS